MQVHLLNEKDLNWPCGSKERRQNFDANFILEKGMNLQLDTLEFFFTYLYFVLSKAKYYVS